MIHWTKIRICISKFKLKVLYSVKHDFRKEGEYCGEMERLEDINTVEQPQNSGVNMEHIPEQNSSKKQKQSHGGVYSCDQCEFKGSKHRLWYHKKSRHEGVRYPCEQCEYVATTVSNLKQHKDAKHGGVRYPWDKCEYVATYLSNLKQHKKIKHEGVRYPCDQCEYLATRVSNLKKHKKRKHGDYSEAAVKRNEHEISETVFFETSNINDAETELKQEENIDDPLSLIKTEPADDKFSGNDPGTVNVSASVKQEAGMCDLESKIEIGEDLFLKTETLDWSISCQWKDISISCKEV